MTKPETTSGEQRSGPLETASACSIASSDDGVDTPSVCSFESSVLTPSQGGEEQKTEDRGRMNGYQSVYSRTPGGLMPCSWESDDDDGPLEPQAATERETSHLDDSAVTAHTPSSAIPPQGSEETVTEGLLSRARSWVPGWRFSEANSASLLEQKQAELKAARAKNTTLQSELDKKERTIQDLLDAEAKRLKESAITTWIKDTVVTTIARILGMVDRVVIKPPQALHERMADQDWYKNTKSRVSGFSVWPLITAVGSTAVSDLPSTVGSAATSVGAAAASAVSGVTEQATKSYNAVWQWGSSYFGGGSEAHSGSADGTEGTEKEVPKHIKPPIVM